MENKLDIIINTLNNESSNKDRAYISENHCQRFHACLRTDVSRHRSLSRAPADWSPQLQLKVEK